MSYLLNEKGQFVSQEHSRVAEMIKAYSPDLDLVWIPLEQREFDEQFPFAILHTPGNKPPYIVRKVQLQDMNEGLIAWLYHSENIQDPNAWADAQDLARKSAELYKAEEAREEMADFASSVIKGKNWYRHNGRVYS